MWRTFTVLSKCPQLVRTVRVPPSILRNCRITFCFPLREGWAVRCVAGLPCCASYGLYTCATVRTGAVRYPVLAILDASNGLIWSQPSTITGKVSMQRWVGAVVRGVDVDRTASWNSTPAFSPLLRSTPLTRDDHAETVVRADQGIPDHIQDVIGRRHLDLQVVEQGRGHDQEQQIRG